LLLSETVIVKWHASNKKRYENKGYLYTGISNDLEISVKDLSNSSHALVNVQCDGCGEILTNIQWCSYTKGVREDGKYYCRKCAYNLFSKEKIIKTKIINGKSFEQWCYDNLLKDEVDKILSRWDYGLNKIHPNEVSYGSLGINRKGYWFKCLEYPEHKSEQKNISSFISGHEGSIICNQCNSISITHPHLIKYLVNKEDALKYSFGSDVKIPMKCPDCGHEKSMQLLSLINNGFACPKCSDGKSYPEKFMFNVLEQLLDKDFKTQLSKNTFKWCKDYRYDNYIDKINCIIETHGIQHYEESSGIFWTELQKTQDNDFTKEWTARGNSIANYIIIDCRKSNINWIKDSIMKSRLPKLLNFKESDINWLKCHEWACNSLVKVVCNLWNCGTDNVSKIGEKLKLHRDTIARYLKQGVELGWCDYDPEEEKRNNILSLIKNISKKVICLTTGKTFDTLKEASNKYNIKSSSSIVYCCKHKYKHAGKYLGESLEWMYYDEYLK